LHCCWQEAAPKADRNAAKREFRKLLRAAVESLHDAIAADNLDSSDDEEWSKYSRKLTARKVAAAEA